MLLNTYLAALAAATLAHSKPTSPSCRTLPGDLDWPDTPAWDQLNRTVGGRLIATRPIASVCHDPNYDEAACNALRAGWVEPETHYETSYSPMYAFYANRSCDAFGDRTKPCEVGSYLSYAVNVSNARDIARTIDFARRRNIRLIVRNTGHDWLGRSTGKGGLAVWTHNLKTIEKLDWESNEYTGPAFRVGAGVQGIEVQTAASAQGFVVVGGGCPSVGIAGGYTQGAGHGPLQTAFGMAADQTLEFEAVTAGGKVVRASPSHNQDLYWALSGGGAGSYAIVTSMTVRAHPDRRVSAVALSFSPSQQGVSNQTFRYLVNEFYRLLPSFLDGGLRVSFGFGAPVFNVQASGYNRTANEVQTILSPLLSLLTQRNITVPLRVVENDKYVDTWKFLGDGGGSGEFWSTGGRLIPRAVLQSESRRAFMLDVWEDQMAKGVTWGGISFAGPQKTNIPNAVLPAWREANAMIILALPWDLEQNDAAWAKNQETQRFATEVLDPQLDTVAPESGNYINEGDFRRPNWKEAFYGVNYPRLLEIKQKWDPEGILYGRQSVGSDRWREAEDGRLCRAS
ncbi:hypothetical protein CAC42_5223 [Sphaceloma murrayae]|uniref:FAD-binding PCMH-type domain-containing protein n=1 Tax=Sphaceloma murrayae TaxID=2082308 RepID=A0A2K1QUE0_9PEZI|nr:hypothetical protein CAC42_5223 [Sphaceloma murrayae]